MLSHDLKSSPWYHYQLKACNVNDIWRHFKPVSADMKPELWGEYPKPTGNGGELRLWGGKKRKYTTECHDGTWNPCVWFARINKALSELWKQKTLAFAMGSHERLGENSPIRLLDPNLLKNIL